MHADGSLLAGLDLLSSLHIAEGLAAMAAGNAVPTYRCFPDLFYSFSQGREAVAKAATALASSAGMVEIIDFRFSQYWAASLI